MFDDRPAWARRIRAERAARRWSQSEAVSALRANSSTPLPSDESLVRNWKRWEAGSAEPDEFYKPLIAKTFGTVTAAFFPMPYKRSLESELLNGTGLDSLEVISRLRASDVSAATLDALRIAADRLCCEYPHIPPGQLHLEGLAWLRRIAGLLDGRLTLAQHREVLSIAGWVTLLVGCVEYDMGRRQEAEATRQAAKSLGQESGDTHIEAWAHEMRLPFDAYTFSIAEMYLIANAEDVLVDACMRAKGLAWQVIKPPTVLTNPPHRPGRRWPWRSPMSIATSRRVWSRPGTPPRRASKPRRSPNTPTTSRASKPPWNTNSRQHARR